MKKKVALAVVSLLMVAGTVSASSVNGDYKGDPIVKITNKGKELSIQDLPAVIHDDRTMVPLYMLKQLGVKLDWDANAYSVNVDLDGFNVLGTYYNFFDFFGKIEAYRTLFFVQQELTLAYIITTAIPYSKSDADLKYVKDKVNSMSFILIDKQLEVLKEKSIGVEKLDLQNFNTMIDHLKQTKEYLFKMDTTNANLHIVQAQTLFNILSVKYDKTIEDIISKKNKEFDSIFKPIQQEMNKENGQQQQQQKQKNIEQNNTSTNSQQADKSTKNSGSDSDIKYSRDDALNKLKQELTIDEYNKTGKIKHVVEFDHMAEDGRYVFHYYLLFEDGSKFSKAWYHVSPYTGSIQGRNN